MYQKINDNLYLVHNAKEFDDLIDARSPSINIKRPEGYVPDELELLYPHRIQLMADYPVLVMFDPIVNGDAWSSFKWEIIPIAKVIGGLGTIRQMNMHQAFRDLQDACATCVPFKQPRILLTGITIKPNLARMIDDTVNGGSLKAVRIQFGDGKFHGSIEQKNEMMFVSQIRDITNLIANIRMDPKTGKFDADYIFNHYDFFNTIPELAAYKDMTKWDITVTVSIESSFNASQKD